MCRRVGRMVAMRDQRTLDALQALATRVAEDARWAENIIRGIEMMQFGMDQKLGAGNGLSKALGNFIEPLREISEKGTATLNEQADVLNSVIADIGRRN
jgi:hypothetical protein